MYGKSYYDIWVQKYGKEKADIKLKELKIKLKNRPIILNKKVSQETKLKLSKKAKLRAMMDGYKNGFYGHTHSEIQKEKWSKERKGRKLEGEWLINLQNARKKNCKKVINIDTMEIFNSIGEVQKKYNLKNGIANVCKGKKKTAAGQRWRFYEDFIQNNNHDNTVPSLKKLSD